MSYDPQNPLTNKTQPDVMMTRPRGGLGRGQRQVTRGTPVLLAGAGLPPGAAVAWCWLGPLENKADPPLPDPSEGTVSFPEGDGPVSLVFPTPGVYRVTLADQLGDEGLLITVS